MPGQLIITPDTKIGALLDAYPHLEDVLVARVPEFKKLKNPILRKTVAKVATIAQAARIGGIDLRELVGILRREAGQTVADEPGTEFVSEAQPSDASAVPPDWLDPTRVRIEIDADQMLATGVHPLGTVSRELRALAPGDILALRSSFRPTPLIETFEREGYRTHTVQEGPDRFVTHIARIPDSTD